MSIEDRLELAEKVKEYPASFAGERRHMHLSVHSTNIDALLQQFSIAGIKINRDLSYYIAPDCDISFNAKLDLGRFDLEGYQLISENYDKNQKEELGVKVIIAKKLEKPSTKFSDVLIGGDSCSIYMVDVALSYTGEDKELGNETIGRAKQIMQGFYTLVEL